VNKIHHKNLSAVVGYLFVYYSPLMSGCIYLRIFLVFYVYDLKCRITLTLTKKDRKQLNIFERKVYRRILGPVYDNGKEKEIYAILKNLP
jgi:hypothetical protein